MNFFLEVKGGVICGKIKETGNENVVRGFRGRWGLRRFVLVCVVTGFRGRWRLGFDFKAFCFTLFTLIQVFRMELIDSMLDGEGMRKS